MKTSSKKNGAILIIVMVLLVAFSLMTVALLQLGTFNEVETIKQLRYAQARWTAEAGLEKALSMVMASEDYRNILSDVTGSIVANTYTGDYEVTVIKSNITAVVDGYTITSTGTVSNDAMTLRAIVQMRLETGPGGQQALLALGGDSKIESNVEVVGTIYQEPPGTLNVGANVDITDIVDAEGGIIGGGAGSVTPGDLPDPDPGPKVDQTDYITLRNYAADTNNVDVVQGVYTGPVALNNDIIYYNGNVTITDITGIGVGTIVATGTITAGDPKINIPSDANLVADGDILFKESIFRGNNEIFTFGNITLDKKSIFEGSGVSLLAIEGVKISSNLDGFQGVIYAEGLYFDPAKDGNYYGVILVPGKQSEMRGTIIAWEGFYIGSNADITYDPSVFSDPSPIDYGSITLLQGSWEEIPVP